MATAAADKFPAGVLYNKCYGGFGFSDECCNEYEKRTGKSLQSYDDSLEVRSDPVIIQLYHEKGSGWMSGTYSDLHFYPVIKELIKYCVISEYDGLESAGLNMKESSLDKYTEFMTKVRENPERLKEEFDRLDAELREEDDLRKRHREYYKQYNEYLKAGGSTNSS